MKGASGVPLSLAHDAYVVYSELLRANVSRFYLVNYFILLGDGLRWTLRFNLC